MSPLHTAHVMDVVVFITPSRFCHVSSAHGIFPRSLAALQSFNSLNSCFGVTLQFLVLRLLYTHITYVSFSIRRIGLGYLKMVERYEIGLQSHRFNVDFGKRSPFNHQASSIILYRLLRPGRIGNEFPHAPTLLRPHSYALCTLIKLANRNVGSYFRTQPHICSLLPLIATGGMHVMMRPRLKFQSHPTFRNRLTLSTGDYLAFFFQTFVPASP